jgi:hypothetical protein
MNNPTDFKRNEWTASIVMAFGVLIMIVAIVIFLFVDRDKSQKLTTRTFQLNIKDSVNTALHDTLKSLRPVIEPMAYAIPTNRMIHRDIASMPKESPEFNYYLCLGLADSVRNKITKVDYLLNSPALKQKHLISVNPLDSFKVNYKGWGCIDTVSIFIFKKDTVRDTLYFRMCDNLRLRGGRMKGE